MVDITSLHHLITDFLLMNFTEEHSRHTDTTRDGCIRLAECSDIHHKLLMT